MTAVCAVDLLFIVLLVLVAESPAPLCFPVFVAICVSCSRRCRLLQHLCCCCLCSLPPIQSFVVVSLLLLFVFVAAAAASVVHPAALLKFASIVSVALVCYCVVVAVVHSHCFCYPVVWCRYFCCAFSTEREEKEAHYGVIDVRGSFLTASEGKYLVVSDAFRSVPLGVIKASIVKAS